MSEMRVTNAMEDKIKLAYAQEHKGENMTTETWKSPEFLQFREKQLKPLNEAFTEFVNKTGNDGESFYDSQALNNVYQNNISGKFRKEAGLNVPLWTRIANRVNVANKEAVGEFREGADALDKMLLTKAMRENRPQAANKLLSGLAGTIYMFPDALQRLGDKMVEYGMSDSKKDFLDNPLKYSAKKVVALYGAVFSAGGATMKFAMNPGRYLAKARRAYENRQEKKKANAKMTLAQGARLMAEQRDRIRNAPTMLHSQELANAASASRSRGAAFKEQATKILNGESRQPTIAAPEKTSNGIQIDKGREL